MPAPPARIGMAASEVETPALLIDLDAYERNLGLMAESLAAFPGVRLRPHAKTHRCPTIARHQVDRGAIGVCCQTLGEAEAMVEGGVIDVLITNQVVSPGKIARLVQLATRANVMVCADDEHNVRDLAAASAGVRLPVLVEIDIGQHRCGVEPGATALALARKIADSPSLRFAGLQAYQGLAQHIYEEDARREAMREAIDARRSTVELLRAHGLPCDRVTGGGTGTCEFEAASTVYTEVQSGSYIFMDADYLRVQGAPRRFEPALFVLATVISANGGRCVIDAGLKASSLDSGPPLVEHRPDLRYLGASDEHAFLEGPGAPSLIGQTVRLIPGHCDPTVNLHNWFVGMRGDRVEALWPIEARGASA